MSVLNKVGYWYLVVLSLFYCSSRVFIAFMFHDLSLLAMCTIVSFFVFFDVRFSHLNKRYLLTYLTATALIKRMLLLPEREKYSIYIINQFLFNVSILAAH